MTRATSAGVSFCENSRDAFDKTPDRQALNARQRQDFTFALSLMRKGTNGIWTMTLTSRRPGRPNASVRKVRSSSSFSRRGVQPAGRCGQWRFGRFVVLAAVHRSAQELAPPTPSVRM